MVKTVAVFFGGPSNEHEISVITGIMAVNLLRGEGYRPLPVYLLREGGMVSSEKIRSVGDLRGDVIKKYPAVIFTQGGIMRPNGRKKTRIDCALNCCHGGPGEDGTLAALLAWNGIPSASPATPVSALFMDKALSKYAARGLGIPVAEGFVLREGEALPEELRFPLIVKPAHLGSSIGIRVAKDRETLERALALAFTLDDCVLVEEYLAGKRDLNCAVCRLGGEVKLSPVEEVFSGEDILTFAEKYEGTGGRASAIPAAIPAAIAEEVHTYTRLLYETFGGKGVMRADFLLAGDRVLFNELNTVPGSLSGYLFASSLTETRAFFIGLVEEGMKPCPKKKLITTGILERGPLAGGKGKRRA